VLATPFFLLFIDPAGAIQIVILLTTVLSAAVLKGLDRAGTPRLLRRLLIGGAAGLPVGLAGFIFADAGLVRFAAGATVLVFALLLVLLRRPGRPVLVVMSPARDIAAGAVSGAATALVGMSGPPVLIYLLLAGVPAQAIRATLLAFFAVAYAVTALFHAVTVGIPADVWLAAGVLLPVACFGGWAGRPLGSRLGENTLAVLAIALLAVAGLYTLAATAGFIGFAR
jgi:uncharacterized membrane protein YfcA